MTAVVLTEAERVALQLNGWVTVDRRVDGPQDLPCNLDAGDVGLEFYDDRFTYRWDGFRFIRSVVALQGTPEP